MIPVIVAILVLLNGKPIEFKDAQPFVKDGRVMVPLRGVFEEMGASVEYSAPEKSVKLSAARLKLEFRWTTRTVLQAAVYPIRTTKI